MDQFEISKSSFVATMTPEPFLPTNNFTPHQSNATLTSGMKGEKEEKEERQPKKTKHQKKKQKEKEKEDKLSQTEAELATLKASNEVTVTERDTLKEDLEKSNKLHVAYKVRAVQNTIGKYNIIKELKANIRELKAKINDLTAAAAEAQGEKDVTDALINELEGPKKRELFLDARSEFLLEKVEEMEAKVGSMTAALAGADANMKELTASAAETRDLVAEARAINHKQKAAAAEARALEENHDEAGEAGEQ